MNDKLQKLNNEFNALFNEQIFMPTVKFAATLIFLAIVIDYGFQMIEAIDILTN